MPKVIKYELSDEQVEKLKKIYENTKHNLKSDIDSFDKFLNWTVEIAIESHIQFSTMNDKMMDMFNSSMNNSNFDLNNIDEFINNIFDTNVNKQKKESKKPDDSDKSTDSTKSNRIKN